MVYFKAGKREEPYVTISRKISLKKGQGTPMEWEIGQSERTLATHRNAFKRTAVIQAFLGSTPQLTLQLYATIQEKYFLPVRGENDYVGLFENHYFICILAEVEIPNHDILRGLAGLQDSSPRILQYKLNATASLSAVNKVGRFK